MQLRTYEILSWLKASAGTVNPVSVENFCTNSAITEVSLSGLHQNTTHISILGMEFASQLSCGLQQMLTHVKSIKIFIQNPIESHAQSINCTWNTGTRRLMAVGKEFLSHVKIFYSKSPCIEFFVVLCDERELPSTTCDIPHPAFSKRPPQSSIMAALYDDNQVLCNLPNVSVAAIRDESPDMYAVLDYVSTSDSIIEASEVACGNGNLGIRLNSTLLYSIIKEESVGAPYPEAFKTTLPVDDCEFSVLLKVFPFKSRSEHISVWAEVTAPLHARGQVTLQVTTVDTRNGERLGCTVKHTERLKHSDLGDCKNAKFTLDEVMLHMFAFYKIPDVKLCISITAS